MEKILGKATFWPTLLVIADGHYPQGAPELINGRGEPGLKKISGIKNFDGFVSASDPQVTQRDHAYQNPNLPSITAPIFVPLSF